MRKIIIVALAIAGALLFPASAAANPPGGSFTASDTAVTIVYSGPIDSIDVNIRINGVTENYHPNTGHEGLVPLVITYASLGLPDEIPEWVQVHGFDCHIGEPGSPGFGTVCYEEPAPVPDPSDAHPEPPVVAPGPEVTAPIGYACYADGVGYAVDSPDDCPQIGTPHETLPETGVEMWLLAAGLFMLLAAVPLLVLRRR